MAVSNSHSNFVSSVLGPILGGLEAGSEEITTGPGHHFLHFLWFLSLLLHAWMGWRRAKQGGTRIIKADKGRTRMGGAGRVEVKQGRV